MPWQPVRTALLWLFLLAGFAVPASAQDDSDAESRGEPEETVRASGKTPPPQVLGWLENARIMPDRMLMKAKLDSGAKSNAMHAENIEFYEEDGVEMVRFDLLRDHDEEGSRSITLERPLQGAVAIKLRYTERRDVRPKVSIDFCIAGKIYTADFTLTDRTDFNYPILLGRDFMAGLFIVDPEQTFTHRTRCPRS